MFLLEIKISWTSAGNNPFASQEDRLEALTFRPKTMAETDALEVWLQDSTDEEVIL